MTMPAACDAIDGLRDADGCYPLNVFLRYGHCRHAFEGRPCFSLNTKILDKHGHELDGDNDPLGANGCDHRDTQEWKLEHKPKRKPLMETVKPSEPSTDLPIQPVVLASNDESQSLTASVGVDTAIGQVKSLVPADGGSAGVMIAGAAILAVIGAAIKLGPKMLEASSAKAEKAHELEMERLKLEREKSEKQDDGHGKCAIERAALEAKVVALEERISAVASKSEEGSLLSLDGFDPQDIEKRLKKIEGKIRGPGRPPKAKK